ncbi:MAG: hypothetical protein AAFP82_19865 [Bacteroidota bacterium]
MKIFYFFALLFTINIGLAQSQNKVYVFLLEDCVISQYYTLQLKTLHEKYASEEIEFIGVFPNRFSKPETIAKFKEEYQLPFELKYDYYQKLTKEMGATVTPEVVVYDETEEKIIYKGRIDNTYFRVGKRRQVTTSSELADVLEALTNNVAVGTESTVAIGCYIKFE